MSSSDAFRFGYVVDAEACGFISPAIVFPEPWVWEEDQLPPSPTYFIEIIDEANITHRQGVQGITLDKDKETMSLPKITLEDGSVIEAQTVPYSAGQVFMMKTIS